jgi:hypothetical protein
MIKSKISLFLIMAALLVVQIGCGGGGDGSSSSSSGGGSAADSGLASTAFIPANAAGIIDMDFKAVMAIPGTSDGIDEALASDPDAQRIIKALNIDLANDLKHMTVGMFPPEAGASEPSALIIVKANLDLANAISVMEKEAADDVKVTKMADGDLAIYKIEDANDPNADSGFVTEYEGNIVATNKVSMLKEAIDTAKADSGAMNSSGFIKDYMNLVDQSDQLWFLVNPKRLTPGASGGGGPMDDIQVVGGGYKAGSDLAMHASLVFGDANNAQTSAMQVNGMVQGFGPMLVAQAPEFQAILDNLKVEASGATMNVNLNLSKSEMEGIAKAAQAMQNQMGGPGGF